MTNVERFGEYFEGHNEDFVTVYQNGEELITRNWIVSDGKRVRHTTIFCAWCDDTDEGFHFETLKEARKYIEDNREWFKRR